MGAIQGRPVLMQRFPNGVDGSSFFQKRVPKDAPDWLETSVVSTPNGTTSQALVAADLAHIVWAVNLGCLGFHVWPNLAADDDHADELRIDLDPQPGVAFDEARIAGTRAEGPARRARASAGGRRPPATAASTCTRGSSRSGRRSRSGGPRSRSARELARRRPDVITDAWWKEERGERIFVDFNQNAPHKTVFGAWSVRARPGAQVSTPFDVGRARRHRSRGVHDGDRARPRRVAREPVGRTSTTILRC